MEFSPDCGRAQRSKEKASGGNKPAKEIKVRQRPRWSVAGGPSIPFHPTRAERLPQFSSQPIGRFLILLAAPVRRPRASRSLIRGRSTSHHKEAQDEVAGQPEQLLLLTHPR
eukprot:scaffold2544_cov401-Prasinococcus_capsulatus_cf.AAC.3